MGAPQYIVLAILLINFGISIAEHGQPKTGHENALSSLFSVSLWIGLLYWGGFFS